MPEIYRQKFGDHGRVQKIDIPASGMFGPGDYPDHWQTIDRQIAALSAGFPSDVAPLEMRKAARDVVLDDAEADEGEPNGRQR